MALIKNSIAATMARDAIVLDLGDLRVQGEAITAAARREAAAILATARTEAAQLVAAADARGHAEGLERGRTEGSLQGQAQGRQEVLDQLGPQLQALMTKWNAALDQWERDRAAMLLDAREEVLAFAVAMGDKLTSRIADIDPTVVEDQLAEALSLLTRPSAVTVTIHPDDRAVVDAVLPKLAQRLSQCKHVQLTESADIGRGGCVVATAGGRIDATLRTQIDRIVAALLPDPARRLSGPAEPEPSKP